MSAEHPKLDLLIKLLAKSTTDCDPEALMAIRMANSALAKEGWTWEQLLRGRITVVADPFTSIQRPSAPTSTARPSAPQRPSAPRRPAPPPPPPAMCSKPNQFADTCYCCGKHVAIGAGFIFRTGSLSKWHVSCTSDAKFLNAGGTPPPRKVRPQRMSVDDIFTSV